MHRYARAAIAVASILVAVSPASAGRPPAEILVGSLPAPRITPELLRDARATAASSAVIAATCPTVPRATQDRPDERTGSLVHVIYLLPSDKPDGNLDTNGMLDCSLRAQNQWFAEQSGLRWRLDTFTHNGVTMLDVTFVRSAKPASRFNGGSAVRQELMELGFEANDKRYLSYVASNGGGACGDAFLPLGTNNVVDGVYAQVYLDSPAGCRARSFGVPGSPSFSEMIAQQEMIHNDGVVGLGAPHGCQPGLPYAHVCTGPLVLTEGLGNLDPERVDVMFPYVSLPLSKKVLDRGNDDYFNHPLRHRDLKRGLYLEPAS